MSTCRRSGVKLVEYVARVAGEYVKARTLQQSAEIGAELDEQCFVFAYAPDNRRPCILSGVTHRYAWMVSKLGLRTRLHSMRRYSATELLSGGVDLRAVAQWHQLKLAQGRARI